MGLKDLLFSKARKAIVEALPQEENQNLIQNDEIEKASYSEHSYKKVQKLREKGKYWAYDVPYLQHPVKKQEKPRPIFIAFGVIYSVMFAFVFALSVLIVTNFLLPLILQALEVSGMVKLRAWDIFGFVAMASTIAPLFMWVIVVFIGFIIIALNLFLILQAIGMFKMSKISMQEMAKGYEVGNMLFRLVALIVITLVVGIAILVMTREKIQPAGIALVVGVMLGVCAVVGTVFGLLLSQRLKAKKEFEQLPEEQRNDFIRHNAALDRIQRKGNHKDRSIVASSKVDF